MKPSDIHHVPARHDYIDQRLLEWARWVRVRQTGWFTQPMFRMYQSKARQWEENPHIHIEVNGLAALEIERAVSILPDKHRSAIRWAYVFPWVPDARIRAELGLTKDGLCQMLNDGRSMLCNRLKTKIVDVG